jgi:hypothetical protein
MKKILLSLLLCGATLAATPMLRAAPAAGFVNGHTVVRLSDVTVGALGTLGVRLTALPNSTVSGRFAVFPITAGAIDLANAKGEILHSGGLTFSAGNVRVVVSGFNIDTTHGAVLTGLATVNGDVVGRIPLFNLVLPAGLTLPLPQSRHFSLRGVGLQLTAEAAAALNASFNVTAFAAGLDIGLANVGAAVRKL